MFANRTRWYYPLRFLTTRLVAIITIIAVLCSTAGLTALLTGGRALAAPIAQTGQTALGVVGLESTNLVDAPDGKVVAALESSAIVTALGRSDDNLWVFVRSEGGVTGWVLVRDLVIFGVEELPAIEPGDESSLLPPPTRAATPTALPPTATPRPTQPPTATPKPTATRQSAASSAITTTTQSAADQPATTQSSATTSTGGAGIISVVGGKGAMLVNTPGEDSGSELAAGIVLTVMGRSEDSAWLLVQVDSSTLGWVVREGVVAFGLESLPVVSVTDAQAAMGADSPAAASVQANDAMTETKTAPQADSQSATTQIDTTSPNPDVAAQSDSSLVAETIVRTGGKNLNVRAGPGVNYPLVDKLNDGDRVAIQARNEAATWVQINLGAGRFGWVSAAYLTLGNAITDLPISDETSAAPLPTAVPTVPVATSAPSASQPAAANPPAAPAASAATGLSGKLIVSTGNGGAFYLYNLATGELRQISSGYDPDINRDGTLVTFARAGGENGIYVVNLDGSGQRKLFGGSELLGSPKFSPDGTKIVFSKVSGADACRDLGFAGICLPDEPEFSDLPLATSLNFGLARVRVDDKEYRDLATIGNPSAPDWHEDGIVYKATTGLKITADKPTVEVKTVTEEKGWQDPDWQPVGGRIVLQMREGDHWEIYTTYSDASSLVALTKPASTFVSKFPSNVSPAWSPDGQTIVFLSNRDANNSAGPWGVWVMSADGSNQRRLPIELPIAYNYAQEQMLSWGR